MSDEVVNTPGREKLWLYFGLSRASWLTLPRVLLHEMPDEWQSKFADLLKELDEAFPGYPDLKHFVTVKKGNKFVKVPRCLADYRHPDKNAIAAMRSPTPHEP
jgi:hypothetical protein